MRDNTSSYFTLSILQLCMGRLQNNKYFIVEYINCNLLQNSFHNELRVNFILNRMNYLINRGLFY